MTDLLVRQTVPASFRGVQFRIRDEVQDEAGRRVILHEYPNSNQRFVEDIGQIPPVFKIEAFVHGADFLSRARALENALNTEGIGELIMPVFGTVEAYALPYRKSSTQANVGEIVFSLEFALGRPTSGPSEQENVIEDLYGQGDNARAETQIALALLWERPETALNIATAEYDVLQFVQTGINQYNTLFENSSLGAWQDTANDIARGRSTLITSGVALAAFLIQNTPEDPGFWQQISLGVPDGLGTTQAIRGSNFGSDLTTQSQIIFAADPTNVEGSDLRGGFDSFINLWPEDTVTRTQRNQNRRVLAQTYRVNSLVVAYEQAAAFEYSTEDQIVETRELLYQAYDVVMREGVEEGDGSGQTSIQLQPGVRFAIENVRAIAGEILERKAQSSPGLTTIDLAAPRSALELGYLLYAEDITTTGELTAAALGVRGLNPTQSAVSLKDDLTIFDRAPS
jgi:hypothetical protein